MVVRTLLSALKHIPLLLQDHGAGCSTMFCCLSSIGKRLMQSCSAIVSDVKPFFPILYEPWPLLSGYL